MQSPDLSSTFRSSQIDPRELLRADPSRRSVLQDVLTPAAKAALLSTATLAGTAALAPHTTRAQVTVNRSFADASANLTDMDGDPSTAVGDLDGDGDLDLVVVGNIPGSSPETKIYENDGSGNFNDIGAGLDGTKSGSVSLGDLDGDGDLDLLVTGQYAPGDKRATIYENQDTDNDLGPSDFSAAGEGLTPVSRSSSSIADLDGDGDLDLLVTGVDDNSDNSTIIYENVGSNLGNVFSPVGAGLEDFSYGATSVRDLDGDGNLDLLLTGNSDASNYNTIVYENDDTDDDLDQNDFSAVGAGLTGVRPISSNATSIGDLDGDGDLDLLVTGTNSNNNSVATIYKNDDTNNDLESSDFSEVGVGLAGVGESSASMGDVDGDGDLDLLVAGDEDFRDFSTILYENTDTDDNLDTGDFSAVGAGLQGVYYGGTSVGDLDGDGDLDLLVAGEYGSTGTDETAIVYENQSETLLTANDADGDDASAGDREDAGWRMLGFPANVVLGDLEDDFNFDFQNDIRSGAVAYTWDGSDWQSLDSDGSQINRGEGMIFFLFDDSQDPVDNDGLTFGTPGVGNGREDFEVSGLPTNDFVLLGNPYRAAFDLNALDINSTDFQQTVQIWDPVSGSYQTLTRGTDPDNIPAMQGFFVERKSSGSTPTSLTFSASGVQDGIQDDFFGDGVGSRKAAPADAAKSGATQDLRQARLRLSLTVENEGTEVARDVASVLFDERAEAGWDAFEATQIPPPFAEQFATLQSPTMREGTLARRTQASVPFPADSVEVPLSVRAVETGGTATLSMTEALPEDWIVELEDRATGEIVDLGSTAYTFEVAAGDGQLEVPDEARFRLRAAPPSAIPVELTRFTAKQDGEGALLTWRTASETNNAGFEVQRLVGKSGSGAFEPIGFVEGAGTTGTPQSYRFHTDPLPVGTHRFRLKQVDTDGSAQYSEPVELAVRIEQAYRIVPPSPNPAQEGARLRLAVEQAQEVTVAVYDLLGRTVETAYEGRVPAQTERSIRVGEDLAAGTYFVRVDGERFTTTERLTVVE